VSWRDRIFANLVKHLSWPSIWREERRRIHNRRVHEGAIFVEDPRAVDNLIFQNFVYRLKHVSLGCSEFPSKTGTAKFLRPIRTFRRDSQHHKKNS
jgi:hypothetical protein